MKSKETKNTVNFSEAYTEELGSRYSQEIIDGLNDIRYAPVPGQTDERLAYVRLEQGKGQKPVIYIPGFTEGIIAKAPFAADLASRGFDVILPDQNRKGILKNPKTGKRDATYTQAMNYLAVLETERIEQADVITHSYGSLILDTMSELVEERGMHLFKDSKVIMLAPGGYNVESYGSLAGRFLKSLTTEPKKGSKDFPDQPEMMKAGVGNFKANISRTALEARDLRKRKVDYPRLLGKIGVGNLAVLSYAGDDLLPEDKLYSGMEEAVAGGVPWAVPIGENYDGKQPLDATHNDEQKNPSRVAAAVAQLLK